MALPSSDYWIATKQVASIAQISDFSYMIIITEPLFFDDCDSDDATKFRFAKNDGTEIPFDAFYYDRLNDIMIARFLWSGNIETTDTITPRIYPAVSTNSSYARTDTYGRDNAYASDIWGYWPLHDANDRTVNANNLTANGSLVFGGATGIAGEGTQFNSSTTDYASIPSTFDVDQASTYFTVFNCDDINVDRGLFGYSTGGGSQFQYWIDNATNDRVAGFFNSGVGYSTTFINSSTWYTTAISRDLAGGVDSVDVSVNGSNEVVTSEAYTAGAVAINIGASGGIGKLMNGIMQHASIHTAKRSEAYKSEESSQLLDNTTFWGTLTKVFVSGSGGFFKNRMASLSNFGGL